MSGRIAVGSRGSALALVQARLVMAALERDGRQTRLIIVETAGDRRAPDTAWGEGAFVAAIEEALLDGRIDVAVHSAKDVPIEQDARLLIAAFLPRADPRDALVVRHDAVERRLMELQPGTRIGTDSPRRAGFVLGLRPDLIVRPLHGNVDTRLCRLDSGEADALILACAGLDRLGLGGRIAERLDPDAFPPAPGQGAIAVQIRRDDGRLLALSAVIDDGRTRLAVETERLFLEAAGGGCRAPVGALATIDGLEVELLAGRASSDGSVPTIRRRRGAVGDGPRLAREMAAALRPPEMGRTAPGDPGSASLRGGRAPRVLVTRAAGQALDLIASLRSAGLEPVHVPAIAIEVEPAHGHLDRAVGSLQTDDWVVVTSANGARAILTAVERILTEPGSLRWAAIGPATSKVLEGAGVEITFRPSRRHARAMAAELPLRAGERVLLVRGDLADGDVAGHLRLRGATVEDVVAYQTVEGPETSRAALRRAVADGPFDAVVLTSGSTVRGIVALAPAAGLDVSSIPAVCIGPETARAAGDAGFRVVAVAPHQDAATLARTTADVLFTRPMETLR